MLYIVIEFLANKLQQIVDDSTKYSNHNHWQLIINEN